MLDGSQAEASPERAPEESQVKEYLRLISDCFSKRKTEYTNMAFWQTVAKYGASEQWVKSGKHVVNITDMVIQTWTSSLYARNPSFKHKRRQRMEGIAWNGTAEQLQKAQALLAQAMQAAQQGIDPLTMGEQALMQADAIVQDAERVAVKEEYYDRLGQTLVCLMNYFLNEQDSDVETKGKLTVRRAQTNGIAYAKLGFQRAVGYTRETQQQLTDSRKQLAAVESATAQFQETQDENEREVKAQELRQLVQNLSNQQVIIREGPVLLFPRSEDIYIDLRCPFWGDLSGADFMGEKYRFDEREMLEQFPDFDKSLVGIGGIHGGDKATPVKTDVSSPSTASSGTTEYTVYEHYDRRTGMVYHLCEGYPYYLREPKIPDVAVDGFFPYEPLVFNEAEDSKSPAPLSEVSKMKNDQKAINESVQWGREHKRHNLPKYVADNDVFDDKTRMQIRQAIVGQILSMKTALDEGQKITDKFMPLPTMGFDPNMYTINEYMDNINLETMVQQAQLGAPPKNVTATAVNISQGFFGTAASSKKNAVNKWLNRLAKKLSQVMLANLSPQTVAKICGPGAVWPALNRDQIISDVWVAIENNSSMAENREQEAIVIKELVPLLLQIPGISPTWVATTILKVMDSDIDLSEALDPSVETSIIAQNTVSSSGMGDGGVMAGAGMGMAQDPRMQGGQGGIAVPQGAGASTVGGVLPDESQRRGGMAGTP